MYMALFMVYTEEISCKISWAALITVSVCLLELQADIWKIFLKFCVSGFLYLSSLVFSIPIEWLAKVSDARFGLPRRWAQRGKIKSSPLILHVKEFFFLSFVGIFLLEETAELWHISLSEFLLYISIWLFTGYLVSNQLDLYIGL